LVKKGVSVLRVMGACVALGLLRLAWI
jgi:hypothetical protein